MQEGFCLMLTDQMNELIHQISDRNNPASISKTNKLNH